MSLKSDFNRAESGQALIVSAVCMVCLLGFLALATDVGMLFRDKVNLQKVADAAAIAGAAQMASGNYMAAAQDSAAQNGVTNGVNGTVTVTLGTAYHANAVNVHVSQNESTFFMGLFGQPNMNVGASAAAGITNGNGCMFAMDTSPFKNEGMTMNGTGNVNVPNCSVYDNSGLNMNGNSGSITAKFIGVAGSFGGGNASPTPVTGMVPVPDPMSYWNTPQAPGSCANDPKASKAGVIVSPGCYKALTVSAPATLSPGLYIVDGALNLSGVSATGVSFYIDGNKNGTLGSLDGSNLTAPTTGAAGTCTTAGGCNGMLIWDTETTGKAQQGVAFGPHGSTLTGILYFPNASLKFHGDTTTTLNADIVAQSYVFDGTINMNNYVLSPGQSPLFMTPTLLE